MRGNMSKNKKYNYAKIVPILQKAKIKVYPPNLDSSNPRLMRQVHLLFWRLCKLYGVEFDYKKHRKFRSVVYRTVWDSIYSHGCITHTIFRTAAESALISEFGHIQNQIMKESLGRVVLPEHSVVIGGLPSYRFYQSPEWRALRYATLERYGNKCQACGRSPNKGVVIHVDHIKPRSYYPELALEAENLQILCEDCNMGKSNRLQRDWRERPAGAEK